MIAALLAVAAFAEAHPLLCWCIVGAAVSATASATRLTHPRLSAWLSVFAAGLPADVTRMSPGAAPKTPPVPAVVPQDEVPTVPTPREPPR